jgi:hypothetical protein
MVRSFARWRQRNEGSLLALAIHTTDGRILHLLRSGKLDLSELMHSPDETRFWIHIHRGDGSSVQHLVYAGSENRVCDTLSRFNIPASGWFASVSPWFGEENRNISPEHFFGSADHGPRTISESGIFPGSVLRIRFKTVAA